MNHLDHGIRCDPLPKASARPRFAASDKRSEAAKSLRTSLARRIELVATGWLVWREGESSLYSEDDFFDGAAESVESSEAGGYNGRRRQIQLDRCIENKISYKTVYLRVYKLCLCLSLSTTIVRCRWRSRRTRCIVLWPFRWP